MQDYRSLLISDLIKYVAKDDEGAYRELYDRYKKRIYSTVYNLSDDSFVAEEVLQETLIRVWNYRKKLHNVNDFDAWIYRVAKNIFFKNVKKLESLHDPLDLILHDIYHEEGSYSDMEYTEMEQAFEQAIENLPPKQRITYQMIKVEGLSRKEVAKLLDVSTETVKWNLDESVKKVRSTMINILNNVPLIAIFYYLQKK